MGSKDNNISMFDVMYKNVSTNKTTQSGIKMGFGIASATALGDLLWKGRPLRSISVWAIMFLPTAMSTMLYIDYKSHKQKLKMQQYEVAMKNKLLTDGTADDPKSATS